jgi:hypothetical protein
MMKRDMIQLLVEGEIGSILKIRPADKNDNASSEIRANPAMSSWKGSFLGDLDLQSQITRKDQNAARRTKSGVEKNHSATRLDCHDGDERDLWTGTAHS